MAEKKMVEAITSMEEDFAQWYTDVVKKAELIDYTSVKGCMVIKPAGYAIWSCCRSSWTKDLRPQGCRTYICPCLSPRACWRKKRIM